MKYAALSLLLAAGLFGSNVQAKAFHHAVDFKAFNEHVAGLNGFQHEFQLEHHSYQRQHLREFTGFAHENTLNDSKFAKVHFERNVGKEFAGRHDFVAHVNTRTVEFSHLTVQHTKFDNGFGSLVEKY